MKQTIALVDDDRNILTSLSIALEKEGFNIQTYLDGESALIGLSRNPPDLAVIDIKMPRMDGEELLKKLKKKMSIPIIFLTSKDDEVDELLGLKLGADDFVKKSGGFSTKVLIELVFSLLKLWLKNHQIFLQNHQRPTLNQAVHLLHHLLTLKRLLELTFFF